MITILLGLSLLVAFLGFLQLTAATMGVGFLAGACLLAIFARIAQAGAHYRGVTVLPVPDTEPSPPMPSPIPPREWSRSEKALVFVFSLLAAGLIILAAIWRSV